MRVRKLSRVLCGLFVAAGISAIAVDEAAAQGNCPNTMQGGVALPVPGFGGTQLQAGVGGPRGGGGMNQMGQMMLMMQQAQQMQQMQRMQMMQRQGQFGPQAQAGMGNQQRGPGNPNIQRPQGQMRPGQLPPGISPQAAMNMQAMRNAQLARQGLGNNTRRTTRPPRAPRTLSPSQQARIAAAKAAKEAATADE